MYVGGYVGGGMSIELMGGSSGTWSFNLDFSILVRFGLRFGPKNDQRVSGCIMHSCVCACMCVCACVCVCDAAAIWVQIIDRWRAK